MEMPFEPQWGLRILRNDAFRPLLEEESCAETGIEPQFGHR